MKIVLQRVLSAEVSVDGSTIAKINKGLLVFLGVSSQDTTMHADKIVDKLSKLRIFQDEFNKTNLSITDVNAELLVVSQFTLYADCKKGNRPSFTNAASPQLAKEIYDYFLLACKSKFSALEHGEFGADMKVSLINDGPFTLVIEIDG